MSDLAEREARYLQAINVIATHGRFSVRLLMRELGLGRRAANEIVEMLEVRGVVTVSNHLGGREIIGIF
jgi:DNA segregation ATPase FtsK/SpoIIIE-like protein